MTYWRQAGITYLKFSEIAAKCVRQAVDPKRKTADFVSRSSSTIQQTTAKTAAKKSTFKQ
ncbi:hypothetical protein B4U79_18367 [Dinothrombium tinctorium]|uniref:ATP synthase subunit epsilon-like protein n=1 Tax=Dinothrombium tinctorium TaxID=1965070 RepID=A0A3S3P3M7_9ACAR|nr:hypothetical protein B4U79_18668 [Dinothrombium tinctorium]RWS04287.1 hypothetical protein B4U79_18374 [Dinothrombium tinctorium]RWS04406.1 hypothetical protein B4U79_18367 [Dinothrombium tinctorium]